MKIRASFVSNSSSSSFIIAAPKGVAPKAVIEIGLEDFCQTITTRKELDDYFLDYYDYKTLDDFLGRATLYERSQYLNCMRKIDLGNVVFMGRASSNGDNLNEAALFGRDMKKCVLSPSVVISSGD